MIPERRNVDLFRACVSRELGSVTRPCRFVQSRRRRRRGRRRRRRSRRQTPRRRGRRATVLSLLNFFNAPGKSTFYRRIEIPADEMAAICMR